jgi:hypothetical protein
LNNDIRDWYLALTDPSKQIFLALVSHDLTIHGRGFGLDLQGELQTRAFKGLEELQHQRSGHISGLGQGRDSYPDDLLVADTRGDGGCLWSRSSSPTLAARCKLQKSLGQIEVAGHYCSTRQAA